MTKPRLFFVTLEDFQRTTGQCSRLLSLLPHLSRHFQVTLVGRKGASINALKEVIHRHIALPTPAGMRPARYFSHPFGPIRLGLLASALAQLPSQDSVIYADSILLAHMASYSPHRRLVCEINGIISEEFRMKMPIRGGALHPLMCYWERKGIQRADHLVVVSPGIATYLSSLTPGVEEKITILGNGVDPLLFSPAGDGNGMRMDLGWDENPVGVFVSTFQVWHGAENLLKATSYVLKKKPDFRLLLVGDGPERRRSERLAQSLGIREAVHFTGTVVPESVPKWIAVADVGLYFPVFVRNRAGFLFDPMKFYEYMAMGKPVVSIRVPKLGDAVISARAGILTDPTPEAFAKGLLNVLDDPEALKEMGLRGAELVRRDFSWSSIADRIAEVC
ncbi:MAG: glycosyltransferase family 4 protein [Deltaproteobacteria bacterium]|nr:glycosyltransferase family 4 protein [Deltaproteobacteria bacterium]